MASLNVFIREKIEDLNTPDHIIETSKDYTVYDYDKRILFTTASRQTTIFDVGTVNAGTFDGDGITYGRITNKGSFPIDLTITNTNSNEAHFIVTAGSSFILSDDTFTSISGSWLDISNVKLQPIGSEKTKVKAEYLLAAGKITA